MGRVNIHLPDELHTKVNKAEINVSAVCQEALEKELRIKEGLKMDNEKLSKLKEKIMKEKEESIQEDFELGRTIAKEWAEDGSIDYTDFVSANRDRITEETLEALDDYIKSSFDEEAIISREKVNEGFISGLQEIGKKVGVEE